MPAIGLTTTQSLEQTQILYVNLQRQRRLRKMWNKRLRNPYAFTPYSERGRVTVEQAVEENVRFGSFAADYMWRAIGRVAPGDEASRLERWAERRKIVGVGFGKKYDSQWLKEVSEVGMETWWIDISDFACRLAKKDLKAQWKNVLKDIRPSEEKDTIESREKLPYPPKVVCGEIRSILADPELVRLDLDSVDIWYFCRLLGCLSNSSMEMVLERVGEVSLSSLADPHRKKAVVVINALKDHNPDAVEKTTTVRTKQEILEKLSAGAGRPVQAFNEEYYQYFSKKITAMTIMAAPENFNG